MNKQQMAEDIEFLEDENQCLKDELEIAKQDIKDHDEIRRLLAYYLYTEYPNNRMFNHPGYLKNMGLTKPFEIAKAMGYEAVPDYENGMGEFIDYPDRGQAPRLLVNPLANLNSLVPQHWNTLRMPNLTLRKR